MQNIKSQKHAMVTASYPVFILVLWFLAFPVRAQDCRLYFPDKPGSIREMKSYDRRDRMTAINRQEIIDRKADGNNVKLTVKSTIYDEKENEVYDAELEFLCEDGVFIFDMKNFLDPATMAGYEDMGVEFTADDMIYPGVMNVGDILPDASIRMVVKSNGVTLLTTTMNITDRKVEAREEIKTEAGTFDSYKISYNTETRAGFITARGSAAEWMAGDVGVVRSEVYNRRGNMTGYSVLSNFK